MIIKTFVLTAFQQNTRVVSCEHTRQAICIDPGEASAELVSYIREQDLKLKGIILTHGHLDHVGGTAALSGAFPDADILIHKDEEQLYYVLPQQPLFMGIQPHQFESLGLDYAHPPRVTRNLEHGEVYEVGNLKFSIRHCPGHTLGHIVMAEESERAVFTGDCLFSGTIGRTDLPGGDHEQLLKSIGDNIMDLPDDFVIYCGHGPETTIGRERETNPFLTGAYQIGKGRYV